jgi:hypothetical protein
LFDAALAGLPFMGTSALIGLSPYEGLPIFRRRKKDRRTPRPAPSNTPAELAAADRRLDMELEQTFPASDPIPWIHDVARRTPREQGT